MSRTVLIEASMSSFMSFQDTMSVFVSNFACVCSRVSAKSSDNCWQRSCASCRLWETSSIQASCAFNASCMSPMSSRIVDISAVTVASTRCLEVMMECVESTRARISSRSTLTASIAAVKSSMSLSQARTMRFTWDVSPLVLFNMSLTSPRSYLIASISCAKVSVPIAGLPSPSPGRADELMKAIFFSTSWDITCNWLVTCASKSLRRLVTFFRSWLSPALPAIRTPLCPGSPASPLLASSDSTRDSSFLNRSLMSASDACDFFVMTSCICRDSAAERSCAYFFTSPNTCERSAVEASFNVANIESVSLWTIRSCSHSADRSDMLNLLHIFARSPSTDSVCLWPACMVSIKRFWFASIVREGGALSLRTEQLRALALEGCRPSFGEAAFTVSS
mmetsp:Transcript_56782/g.104290  ORF Transcript_56782/g.104290 Transcript_56782/m.104290 type:complete len:393 (+) Transcript_56782:1427-2605(+)